MDLAPYDIRITAETPCPERVAQDRNSSIAVILFFSKHAAYQRRHSKFPSVSSWYGHVEIPENEHWDWGSLRWDDLDPGPAMTDALAFVERFKNGHGRWETREISPFYSGKAVLRDWAVVPDSPSNVDNEDELRRSLFNALCENRVWVAKRKVPAEDVLS